MNQVNALNTHCPWSGDPVSADSITLYRQQPVGFCNPGCRDRFERATLHFDALISDPAEGPPPFRSRAVYNRWMNQRLLEAVDKLSDDDYRRDLGAFFRSIHLTLNHLLVWDVTWLKRLAARFPEEAALEPLRPRPMPIAHDQELCPDRDALRREREALDAVLLAYVEGISTAKGAQILQYETRDGQRVRKRVDGVLTHLFNHQTHHRGQITTLLSQLGIDPGDTDLFLTLEDL
ncbi:MAG: DinB family protein [Pseudomonadota bacterium]